MHRVFLLSPARSAGARADLLHSPKAGFELAWRLQRGERIPIGEIFTFLSGLYFRGKLKYAQKFARPPRRTPGVRVITSDRGLLPADTAISLDDLRAFSSVPIDGADPRYREPLARDARELARYRRCEYVLLGSISSGKYVDVLLEALGERLLFPADFVGRGDMSRGGLLLRSVRDGTELGYLPIAGAVRRGPRPPKLAPAVWKGTPLA